MRRKLPRFARACLSFFLIWCCLLLDGAVLQYSFAEERGELEQPAIEAILETGAQRFIQLPDSASCLDTFETKYITKLEYDWWTATVIDDIDDLKEYQKACGPAVPVERVPQLRTGRRHMPWAYEGTEVTVVAKQDDMSCILYLSSDNTKQAGWVQNRFLVDEFPGRRISIGQKHDSEQTAVCDVEQSWSRKGFLNSQQNYTVLSKSISQCVGFTMDYQLISENTNNWNAIFGPRTVYVNDGSEWIKVGTFEYPEHGTVKVVVSLDQPTDIVAIGTIAEVSLPNTFRFRQFVTDFLTVE